MTKKCGPADLPLSVDDPCVTLTIKRIKELFAKSPAAPNGVVRICSADIIGALVSEIWIVYIIFALDMLVDDDVLAQTTLLRDGLCYYVLKSHAAGNRAPLVPHADGPDEKQNIIHVGGKPYQLTPTNCKLLRCIWGKNRGVYFADVGEAVWGSSTTSAGTIKSAVSRLTAEMEKHKLPFAWACTSERIIENSPVAN